MSQIKVQETTVDDLLETADIKVETIFDKCTVVTVKLKNGFVLTDSSACVDPENYDEELGTEICLKRIRNKIWEMEAYALQKKLYDTTAIFVSGKPYPGTFGWALEAMKAGKKARRSGWPSFCGFVRFVRADEIKGLDFEHLSIDGTDACWFPTWENLFAEDWVIKEPPKRK